MPIVANRFVSLSIAALPTLDDRIRGVIPPVQSMGSTVTFTIPSWVEVGDLIYLYSYNRTYASTIYPTPAGWTQRASHSDYADDVTPYPTITWEFPGSTWNQLYHVVQSGDAGTDVTLTYVWAYEGIGPNPITFGNPIITAVVFKGDVDFPDGNWGGVAFDYDYDDASVTYSDPHQTLIYFNGLYGGGGTTPPVGVTTLASFSNDSSIWLGAKMAYGSGSAAYHIAPGNIGIWALDVTIPFV